jgi:DNA polymerase III subunit epsilon
MREVVFDTETTGFSPGLDGGDRVVEVGCVELVNSMPTGKTFHSYINPERDVPEAAFRVHGLSADFLKDHPTFNMVAQDFLDFIDDAKLIAHNAEFDFRFINFELKEAGHLPLPLTRMIDTLQMARMKFPGAANSLDALCKRFNIDNSGRELHGALLDSEILAEVYLELRGGRQAGLDLAAGGEGEDRATEKKSRPKRSFPPSEAELAAHKKFLATLDNPIWD